jgi:ketosteroid isomerase-like protein
MANGKMDGWTRDQLAIRSLVERYSDACCCRDSTALMELWADDCRWSVAGMKGLEDVRGKAAIKQIWENAQALYPFCFLVCVPGDIKINGDTAAARVYTTEVLKDTEGKVRNAVGRYDDRYERIKGEWRFVERTWHMLHQQ